MGMMFQNPEFAKMLELTPEQTTSLREVFRESMEDFRRQAPQPGGAGTPPNPDQMRQRMEQLMDSMQTKVDQVLKPHQQTKARELTFQLTGGLDSAFVSSRTLQVLELTPAQKEQLLKITEARNLENRNAMQPGFDPRNATPEEREKFRTDMEARNKKFSEQITALLTPEQKEKAGKLTADAPALREKLGIPAPGQPGQRGPQGRQNRGQGEGPPPGGQYAPGADSWRPGQDTPPPSRPEGRRNFPRRERSE
jgi:Spy/CpxP family protein refolding chaperone